MESSAPDASPSDEDAALRAREQAFWAAIESRSTEFAPAPEVTHPREPAAPESIPEEPDTIDTRAAAETAPDSAPFDSALPDSASLPDRAYGDARDQTADRKPEAAASDDTASADETASAGAAAAETGPADTEPAEHPDEPSDRPTFTRVFDTPRPSKPGDPESSAS